jgi:cyclophilin family peptidyl-prolyl cis-trans isomerase/protein-disulfide isomerase
MKSIKRIIFISLIGILLLSGCKIKSFTPTPTPTATPSEAIVATEPVIVEPTEPLPLFTEDGKMSCNVYPGLLPLIPAEEATIPPVTDDEWSIGPKDAPLTIIVYDDFQCPACASTYNSLDPWLKDNADEVRYVFRHFPLTSIHDKAHLAGQAAEAAGLQGKFWEMYDVLFTEYSAWVSISESDFTSWLIIKADELDLDVNRFTADLKSDAIFQKVATGFEEAVSLGLNSTPSIFFNGWYWQYSRDYNTMSIILDVVKFEKDMVAECPPWVIDTNKTYTATIETERGDIVIDLYADKAPLAVNSFVYLAQKGFFDGVTFHRVMHDFVAQAGDPSGTGVSGPGYQFRSEVSPDLSFDSEGILGMANSGVDSNGSQFFITYRAAPELDGGYTIFGKVSSGMDVVQKLTERDASKDPTLPEGDKIISITIEEK